MHVYYFFLKSTHANEILRIAVYYLKKTKDQSFYASDHSVKITGDYAVIMWSRGSVLRLYKDLLRYGEHLQYTDKEFYFRRIRKEFKLHRGIDNVEKKNFQLQVFYPWSVFFITPKPTSACWLHIYIAYKDIVRKFDHGQVLKLIASLI